MCTAIKHPVLQRVKPSIVIFSERQSARMSKITIDGLTRSGTFIAVPICGNSWYQRVKLACFHTNPKAIAYPR